MEISDSFLQRIVQVHRDLGIPDNYRESCTLPLCFEPLDLVDCGVDYYERPQRLTPDARAAWFSMQHSAGEEGVVLHLISAFRSIEYQRGLFEKKLNQGRQLAEILKVNAAPGYSEHHTGRAIDLGTDNCPALEVEFEKTHAFEWLTRRAGGFGFSLSYPKNNPYGMIYEPWHWCFQV